MDGFNPDHFLRDATLPHAFRTVQVLSRGNGYTRWVDDRGTTGSTPDNLLLDLFVIHSVHPDDILPCAAVALARRFSCDFSVVPYPNLPQVAISVAWEKGPDEVAVRRTLIGVLPDNIATVLRRV